jgi:hypothetical protein
MCLSILGWMFGKPEMAMAPARGQLDKKACAVE